MNKKRTVPQLTMNVYAMVCQTHFLYSNKYSNQKHCIYKMRKYD